MKWSRSLVRFVAVGLLVAGCGGGGSSGADAAVVAGPARRCNPVATEGDCLLPFPSDDFLVDDPAMPSGRRVAIPPEALPRDRMGRPVDLLRDFPADGFSHGAQILARLSRPVDPATMAGHDPAMPQRSWDRSLAADSPTVLMEAETGRRVAHIAEVDVRTADPTARVITLRPLERLRDETRYVVALRNLRALEGGAVVPPSEGFRRLRDRVTTTAATAERYERDVFSPLQRASVDRASLQLAWSFRTGSQALVTRDMLAVRDDAIARMRATPPAFRVTRVEESPTPAIARRVHGLLRVPLYLDSDAPGARLRRDAMGRPRAEGTAEVDVLIVVPASLLRAGAAPGRVLQFGHGFFGSREEINGSFAPRFAEQHGFIVTCIDWWGMSNEDLGTVVRSLGTDPGRALDFVERVHQAMVNQIALALARGAIAASAPLQREGRSIVDPEHAYFMGISQGHILGGTYLALSPEIRRGVLNVGGADFSLMMYRARPFAAFLIAIQGAISDPIEQQVFAAMSQTPFDRIDPLTWAPHVVQQPLPNAPMGRRVLVQMGIGDSEVPNVGSELHARALGVGQLAPVVRRVPGLMEVSSPHEGSALSVWDFAINPLPGATAVPAPAGNIVHEAVRMLPAAMEQVSRFLRPDGRVEQTCTGPCDPE